MWVYRELAACQPQGEADADAYLAGRETPTAAKKREEKQDGIKRLAAYGGVNL
jgi:hypothetical protein